MYILLIILYCLFLTIVSAQYCALPLEPHVQPHTFEQYGPNGPLCGELRGWSMNHACYTNGTTCGQGCTAGNCYCIYACDPGYCMTQFNPVHDNIHDPSHGVLCQSDGTIKKVYKPNAPLCVPCASKDPTSASSPLVTKDGSPSPVSYISSMTRSVAVCGLMDPGVDDGLQIAEVAPGKTCYGHLFPQWWYLKSVQAQIYIQIPGIPADQSCVTKRNPLLSSPEGNAGFYQVAFTSGGGMQLFNLGGILSYVAFGQIAFFTDFGNNNMIDISMCWKFYGSKCIVNYGIRAWVCGKDQTVPKCRLDCDIFLRVSNVADNGKSATICKQMKKCNLAVCPNPTKCLGIGDPLGCSPVANLDFGERIVYELYDDLSPSKGEAGEITKDRTVTDFWWVALIVVVLALIVAGVAVWYYRYKSNQERI